MMTASGVSPCSKVRSSRTNMNLSTYTYIIVYMCDYTYIQILYLHFINEVFHGTVSPFSPTLILLNDRMTYCIQEGLVRGYTVEGNRITILLKYYQVQTSHVLKASYSLDQWVYSQCSFILDKWKWWVLHGLDIFTLGCSGFGHNLTPHFYVCFEYSISCLRQGKIIHSFPKKMQHPTCLDEMKNNLHWISHLASSILRARRWFATFAWCRNPVRNPNLISLLRFGFAKGEIRW